MGVIVFEKRFRFIYYSNIMLLGYRRLRRINETLITS